MAIKVENQVIVKSEGHSWLGFWTSDEQFNNALKHILELSKDARYKSGQWSNAFWVLDFDGSCVAAQSTKEGALKYYNKNRVLVHYQSEFV
jgi:hypothetical protein